MSYLGEGKALFEGGWAAVWVMDKGCNTELGSGIRGQGG